MSGFDALLKAESRWAWWLKPIIPILRRITAEFKVTLGYIGVSIAWPSE